MVSISSKLVAFLIVSLLLASCASQKSATPLNAADAIPAMTSDRPIQRIDPGTAKKPIAVLSSQSGETQKEAGSVKESGLTTKQTPASNAEPVSADLFISLNVQFDMGAANIKPLYYDSMKGIGDFMRKHSSASAVIQGHTDNIGGKMVNVKLSERRAANIKAYLVEKFGIDGSRIKAVGYDYQKPIASNKTAEGRQKNRRGEARAGSQGTMDKTYSFIEESDLPKGGASIVNQESIDAKIQSFQEKQGDLSYRSKVVEGATLQLYVMWGGIFSHCAIRIETNSQSFYQLELQTLTDLQKVGIRDFYKAGAAIKLLGITEERFDIVEFTDRSERSKLDRSEPNYAAMPICIDNKAPKKTPRWYRNCLSRYARSYNPQQATTTGKSTKVFDYNPILHNCCNFAEEALEACGLAHCFDLGKSTGLNRRTAPMGE